MYTPTQEELIEMGFNFEEDKNTSFLEFWHTKFEIHGEINTIIDLAEWKLTESEYYSIYPADKQDVETLIRILTPNDK